MINVLNISVKSRNVSYTPQVRYLQQKLGTAWFKEVAELEASITRERSGTNRIWKTILWKKTPLNHSLAGTTTPLRPSGRVQTVAMLGESTTTCIGESSFKRKDLILQKSPVSCLFILASECVIHSLQFFHISTFMLTYIWWYLNIVSGLKADSDQQRTPGLWSECSVE